MAETIAPLELRKERERADRNFIAFDKMRTTLARTVWHPVTVAIMRRHVTGQSRPGDLARLLQILGPDIPLGPRDRLAASDPLVSTPAPAEPAT